MNEDEDYGDGESTKEKEGKERIRDSTVGYGKGRRGPQTKYEEDTETIKTHRRSIQVVDAHVDAHV